mmetsp:Transcript_8585/g.26046  ORF Transcript_8585/g.26046 Transcript_8585/m.26046 type:complete len:211 (-) Transcript_8585:230-862(-)|eukprot:364463-Chlamydomonas_euryale.AAC.15
MREHLPRLSHRQHEAVAGVHHLQRRVQLPSARRHAARWARRVGRCCAVGRRAHVHARRSMRRRGSRTVAAAACRAGRPRRVPRQRCVAHALGCAHTLHAPPHVVLLPAPPSVRQAVHRHAQRKEPPARRKLRAHLGAQHRARHRDARLVEDGTRAAVVKVPHVEVDHARLLARHRQRHQLTLQQRAAARAARRLRTGRCAGVPPPSEVVC